MKISASLHAADPLRLAQEVAAVAPYVASLHIDVMDGGFAPAFGFGEKLITRLIAEGAPPVDVHLMVEKPEIWAARFAALGARSVAFHLESARDPIDVARSVRGEGALAYLALLSETPLSLAASAMEAADGLLLLTAPPGGGRLNPTAMARVKNLPRSCSVMVDGRLEPAHFHGLKAGGVELAVIGASLFEGGKPAERARYLSMLAAA